MAGLLVSVRSVAEAKAAVLGGAQIIDIKEPRSGPLGRASSLTWRAIRAAVPAEIAVSVALGELVDLDLGSIQVDDLAGIAFQKAGPAGSGAAWARRWDRIGRDAPIKSGWVAVIYADWDAARAPDPDVVIASALQATHCPGILIDTWDKRHACPLRADQVWHDRISRVQGSGRFVALAGRLDGPAMERLGSLGPDFFAVRGAACQGGDRQFGVVDAALVAQLAKVARSGSTNP